MHLHEAAILGADGVTRIEGLGPRTLSQLQELLGRTHLRVQPVIDLSDRVRSTSYEHPESLKERVHLTTGGDYWPFATSTSRRVDFDHPIPYDATGTAGPDRQPQLRPAESATSPVEDARGLPLPPVWTRQVRLAYPHGWASSSTTPAPAGSSEHARMIIDAPPGVDLYPV